MSVSGGLLPVVAPSFTMPSRSRGGGRSFPITAFFRATYPYRATPAVRREAIRELASIDGAVYTEPMSTEVTRKRAATRRGLTRRNSLAFPCELRDAISPIHEGRSSELDSINGQASNIALFGRPVELKLVVKETGKLKELFVVPTRLQPMPPENSL